LSWQKTGTRRDLFDEANRIEVEVEKDIRERGLYIHPELYGHDKTMSIHRDLLRKAPREGQALGQN
jgi:hypothetical protein